MSRSFRSVNEDQGSTIKFVEIQLGFLLNKRALNPPNGPCEGRVELPARG